MYYFLYLRVYYVQFKDVKLKISFYLVAVGITNSLFLVLPYSIILTKFQLYTLVVSAVCCLSVLCIERLYQIL